MKISIDRTKQSNKPKVFKKLTELPKMVIIDGNMHDVHQGEGSYHLLTRAHPELENEFR